MTAARPTDRALLAQETVDVPSLSAVGPAFNAWAFRVYFAHEIPLTGDYFNREVLEDDDYFVLQFKLAPPLPLYVLTVRVPLASLSIERRASASVVWH